MTTTYNWHSLTLVGFVGFICINRTGKRTRYIREGVRDPYVVTSAPCCYRTKRAAKTALHTAVKSERGREGWEIVEAWV